MTRPAVSVRQAAEADLPTLLALWFPLRAVRRDGAARRGYKNRSPAVVASAEDRMREALTSPRCRIVVAEAEAEAGIVGIVGMAILSDASSGGLMEMPAIQITHLVVAEGQRRRGVGRALVSAAVSWAEEVGADEIVASVLPSLREANRFYARLGFAPLVMRRVVPVATLRRHFALSDPRVARPRSWVPLSVGAGLGLRSRLANGGDTDPVAAVPD